MNPIPLYDRNIESIAEFEAAANARGFEALRLYKRSRYTGAIYLWGYTIEMRLKALAYREVLAAAPVPVAVHQPITQHDRRTAEAAIRRLLALPNNAATGHRLPGWARLVIDQRANGPRPYSLSVNNELSNRTDTAYTIWRETLRYSSQSADPPEARRMRDAAEWFASRYNQLV